MSLHYQYYQTGVEVIAFGPKKKDWVEPEPYFVVSGDQQDIHKYLEAISSIENTKFSVYYDMQMESRHTSVGFSDAMVNLVFCFDPTNALEEPEFKAKFVTPFRRLFA